MHFLSFIPLFVVGVVSSGLVDDVKEREVKIPVETVHTTVHTVQTVSMQPTIVVHKTKLETHVLKSTVVVHHTRSVKGNKRPVITGLPSHQKIHEPNHGNKPFTLPRSGGSKELGIVG